MAGQNIPKIMLAGVATNSFGPFGFQIAVCGVSNPGSTWIYFPQVNGWVAPYTFSALVPLGVGAGPIFVRTDIAPGGFSPDNSNQQDINLTFYEDAIGIAPGFPAPGTGLPRWNVVSAAALGVQASAVKAAASGVTHVGDSGLVTLFNSTAAAGGLQTFSWIDGPSGGSSLLASGRIGFTSAAGSGFPVSLGPGLEYRGTVGNAMTVEFSAGVAGTFESTSISGYDQ